MKIAILSDLHLGYRQYGSMEREEDFYIQYLECMKQINYLNPEIVIIAGDIFDKPNPSPEAMNVYRKGISLLNGIPVYTITGNHTMLLRDNHYTVDHYFGQSGIDNYYLIDDSIFFEDDFEIAGIKYRSDNDLDNFKETFNDVTSYQHENTFHILVVHQAFQEFCGFTGAELSIEDLDLDFYDLIICGHIHSPCWEEINGGKTVFIQPGSIERMNTTEAADEIEKGKGFFIFDTEDKSVDFHSIESPRKFLLGDIYFESVEDIDNHFEELKKTVGQMYVSPIVSYNYYDNVGSSVYIRDLMKKISPVLINNSNVYDLTEEVPELEIEEGELPTILEAIDMKMEGSTYEDSAQLAKDIFELCDNDKDDELKDLLDNFFQDKYKRAEETEKRSEEMRKEIQDFEDFFNNLGEN